MTPFHNSHPQPPFTPHFFVTTLSCDPTTDGQTVSIPLHPLPSIPTLTLKLFFWNLLSCLASSFSYCPPPCPPPLVALCLLTLPLAYPCSRGLYPPPPPARPPAHIPTFITPSAPPSIPPVWDHVIAVLMKLLQGTKLQILGDLPLPYLSIRLLDVGIGHSPI